MVDNSNGQTNRPAGFRLVFHIGAGKTGTSSIQESLRASQDVLRRHGVWYWGLMLELAPVRLYDWQLASASKEFLARPQAQAQAQVEEVVRESVAQAEAAGCHTAIWSNEWFFGRHHAVLPALKAIEASGVEVQIVAYVRRHDAWARSAYIQWGLKHKTYEGPILPFRDYSRRRPVGFAGTLSPWQDGFPHRFMVRNFDAAGDVVSDFVALLGLPSDITRVRTNETPGMEELLIRALYNNSVRQEVPPVNFDRTFGAKQVNFHLAPAQWLESLLPTPAELDEVAQASSEDRLLTNAMLEASGQPELQCTPMDAKPVNLDRDKLLGILLQVVIGQSKKVQGLQREIDALREGIARSGGQA